MSEGFKRELVDVMKCGGNCRTLLNKTDVLEIQRRQVSVEEEEKYFYRSFIHESYD